MLNLLKLMTTSLILAATGANSETPKKNSPKKETCIRKVNNSLVVTKECLASLKKEKHVILKDFNAVSFKEKGKPNRFKLVPKKMQGNNKPAGFKIGSVKPDSHYEKVGLKSGDIIQEINGEKLEEPGRAMELIKGLQTQNSIKIKVHRNGKQKEINIEIK